jgi:hypothetical protein
LRRPKETNVSHHAPEPTPEERRREVAKLLAASLLRFRRRVQLITSPPENLEPMTVVKAYGLAKEDPEQEELAEFPDAKADEAKAAEWAEKWTGNWGRRFNMRPG